MLETWNYYKSQLPLKCSSKYSLKYVAPVIHQVSKILFHILIEMIFFFIIAKKVEHSRFAMFLVNKKKLKKTLKALSELFRNSHGLEFIKVWIFFLFFIFLYALSLNYVILKNFNYIQYIRSTNNHWNQWLTYFIRDTIKGRNFHELTRNSAKYLILRNAKISARKTYLPSRNLTAPYINSD